MVKGLNTKDEKNIWEIRKTCGMVFQNPDNQIVASIVEEDVAFGAENLGVLPSEIIKRVDYSLSCVNMTEFKTRASHFLSGGQKQRIAIAGVLAMKPDCIILDESTAMLDPIGRKEVLNSAIKLNKDENIAIVLITHFMEEAIFADRVVVIEKGKIIAEGTPKHVFSEVEKLKGVGLSVPQVTEIAFNLANMGIPFKKGILNVNEFTNEALSILNNKAFKAKAKPESLNINNINSENLPLNSKPSAPIIQVKNLTYIYNAQTAFERKAIKDVNFTINSGEFVGLIGQTGCGKSTLVKHLNGLLKPTLGEVLIEGKSIFTDKQTLKSVRKKVGLVFQYPENQLFETTVFKDVSFGPLNIGIEKDKIKEVVCEALKIVGIDETDFEKSPFELSGGQKRRVAIAGVLAMKPEILILDEPTAGLDPKGREEILSQISNMHKRLKITIVLVSHSMEDIAKLASKIIVMENGSVKYVDEPKQVFKKVDELEKIGLAAPQISYLMDNLKKANINVNTDIFTVEEATSKLYDVFAKG